jgi:hypothetical protein
MDTTEEEILKRFAQSWADTEKQYEKWVDEYEGFNFLVPLYLFIQRMRKAGEDQFFRLGLVKRSLIFSRSFEPVLQTEQQFLEIEARENSFIVTLRDIKKMHRQYTIKELDDERLTGLLQTVKDMQVE